MVHSADPLVVPGMSFISQIINHLATTPARLLLYQLAQLLRNRLIGAAFRLVAIHITTQLDCATGLSLTGSKFLHGIARQLPFLLYFESFFSMMSFKISCSKLKFAYICFKRRFSSSNSFIRFTSLTLIPPYLAFHL